LEKKESIMRIGILGYGNLGKALVKELDESTHTLIGVFSRRRIYEDKVKILSREDIYDYVGKIDIVLVATSSHSDAASDSYELLPRFNVIDSFDNHKKLPSHLSRLKSLAEENERVAITAAGWDPGLLSIVRAMAKISSGAENVNTFWGAGKSLGHSSLLMNIEGVKYAVQYTVPKDEFITLSKNKDAALSDADRHFRECFIVPEEWADREKIEYTVKNTEGYFKGYDISVNFITESEFLLKHNKDFHRGRVIATQIKDQKKTAFDLNLEIPSNAAFTARIMCSYINAIDYLQNHRLFGAYTPLDIPLSYLITESEYNSIV
jgi:diaminopimelate dehydrogenase